MEGFGLVMEFYQGWSGTNEASQYFFLKTILSIRLGPSALFYFFTIISLAYIVSIGKFTDAFLVLH